jgi:hypothetical protein
MSRQVFAQLLTIYQDSVLQHMSHEQWIRGLRPKVDATWNLHYEFPDVDFFVMLASMNGVAGNASQANYAAGNTFQDAFAAWRTSQGKPTVSIDLDAIADVGYVAARDGVASRLSGYGIGTTQENEFLRLVELAIQGLKNGVVQLLNGLRVDTFDNEEFVWARDKRFSSILPVRPVGTARQSATDGSISIRSKANLAQSLQEQREASGAIKLILDALVGKIASMFGIEAAVINPTSPVSRYGVDSLVAVELRNWIVTTAGSEATSIFDVLQSSSLNTLAERVAQKSRYTSTLFVS